MVILWHRGKVGPRSCGLRLGDLNTYLNCMDFLANNRQWRVQGPRGLNCQNPIQSRRTRGNSGGQQRQILGLPTLSPHWRKPTISTTQWSTQCAQTIIDPIIYFSLICRWAFEMRGIRGEQNLPNAPTSSNVLQRSDWSGSCLFHPIALQPNFQEPTRGAIQVQTN